MGWGSVGRSIILSGLIALLACGCAVAPKAPRATAAETETLRATIRGVYEAVAGGDEAAYRALVDQDPDDAYSDALTATMFASIHLHQALESRSTMPATAASRPSSLAAVDYRENARAMLKLVEGWTFTIRENRATIDQLADHPNAPSLVRSGAGRWVLAPTQWDLSRETAQYRLAVASERELAAALNAARGAIEAGGAVNFEDANRIIRARLAPPTTQP